MGKSEEELKQEKKDKLKEGLEKRERLQKMCTHLQSLENEHRNKKEPALKRQNGIRRKRKRRLNEPSLRRQNGIRKKRQLDKLPLRRQNGLRKSRRSKNSLKKKRESR